MSTTSLIPSLPDELTVNCLARVPRSEHRTLSLVSKRIHSLLYSLHFFNARCTLHCTHQILYFAVNKLFSTQALVCPSLWFTHTLHHSFLPLPSPRFCHAYTVIGPRIYAIGGHFAANTTRRHVWVMDSHFDSWQKGPSRPINRYAVIATIINGRIYVMGGIWCGYNERYYANWVKFLDPTTNRWETIPSPPEVQGMYMPYAAIVVDGKLCIKFGDGGSMVVLNTYSGTWKDTWEDVILGWVGHPYVIEGIIYCPNNFRGMNGFDLSESTKKMVNGLAGMPGLPLNLYTARLDRIHFFPYSK